MQLYRLVQWLALAGLKFLVHLKLNLEFLKIKKVQERTFNYISETNRWKSCYCIY